MLQNLNDHDGPGIASAFEALASLIAHISYMSGVPPGTVPATIPSNRDISKAYRSMVTSLSKLGLSADICQDKSEAFSELLKKPRSSSIISSQTSLSHSSSGQSVSNERKFSIISELSEYGKDIDPYKLCARETKTLMKTTKHYIKQFKRSLKSSIEGNDSATDDSVSVTSRSSSDSQSSISYSVKQFRAGTWANVNISAVPPQSVAGMGRPPRRKSIFPLEAYDSIIPLDNEVITVLEYQRTMVFNILRQIFSLINKSCNGTTPNNSSHFTAHSNASSNSLTSTNSGKSPQTSGNPSTTPSSIRPNHHDFNNSTTSANENQNYHQGEIREDKRVLFVSSLNTLVAIVTNMSNLLESLDLLPYQAKPITDSRRPAAASSANGSSYSLYTPTNVPCLVLLYDFVNVRQTLYEELMRLLYAVQNSDIFERSYIESFAAALESMASTSTVSGVNSSNNSIRSSSSLSLSSPAIAAATAAAKSNSNSIRRTILTSANIPPKSTENLKPTLSTADSEQIIKMRVMELGVVVDAVVQTASLLAEEKPIVNPQYDGINSSSTSIQASIQDPSLFYADSSRQPRSRSSSLSYSVNSFAMSTNTTSSTNNVNYNTPRDDLPWFLRADYADEIIYDAKNSVRGGTLPALIERLTQHDSRDSAFNSAFLLTFRSFTSPQKLFESLVGRYGIQPPEGLSPNEYTLWSERKQKPIRLRVANILKKWLEEYWFEDPHSKQIQSLLQSMLTFTVELEHQKSPGWQQIRKQIEMKMKMDYTIHRRIVQNQPTLPPTPILPKNLKKIKLSDLDPLELARQLTLREYKLFVKITPYECLTRRQSKSKTRHNTLEGTPYIDAFIRNSNNLTNWVAAMILSYSDPKKRAQAIKYFTNVAEYCRQCNNFSSMMAIISALSSATIHRLKKTWELVPEKTNYFLQNMNRLMNSSRNFSEYRDILRLVSPPVIPFFGVYLTDLTFLEDANSDFLQESAKLINFSKRMKSADIIRDIMQYQIVPYVYKEIPEIQTLLTNGYTQAQPIDAQYDLSLELEPRANSDERVTKLLAETGFL